MQARTTIQGPWQWVVAAVVLVALPAGSLLAQTSTGSIRGMVRDRSGPVAGVPVTATNVASGIKYTASTLPDGSFLMSEVNTRDYDVTTAGDPYLPGSGKVRVLIGQTATLEFTLSERARATESVTVSAA